jgi:hypothetical protein
MFALQPFADSLLSFCASESTVSGSWGVVISDLRCVWTEKTSLLFWMVDVND